ncbi:MAG: 30S ribosomal protein S9 [Myxococcales bacterium]|nr:30S ribosomal protein S9 [Myxococcales bacterium]|tara:strand:- start:562 stop:960 length:399 start_codon:yes stop_codon:yes gene_type:complete
MSQDQEQWHAVGRRKSAVARVYLRPGTGIITVNGRKFEEYLPGGSRRQHVTQPLALTETTENFDILVNVKGGGLTGQAGAMRHGITRALIEYNAEFRGALKKAGYVTRDAREVERKKYGQPGARKRFQFSKR